MTYTDPTSIDVGRDTFRIVTCETCGAAVILGDPVNGLASTTAHDAWHAEIAKRMT